MPVVCGDRVRLCLLAGFVGLVGVTADGHPGLAASLPEVRLSERNTIPACVTPERLTAFLRSRNSHLAPRYLNVARQYQRYGQWLGVRWDIGFFQMMVETANLTFRRPNGEPGDVAPEHNNFAGIGAVGDGRPGEIFSSIAHGVRAHLEHVLYYSGVAVPAPVAERTRKVQLWRILEEWHKGFDRPITYGDVARRWAPQSNAYLASIEYLALKYQKRYCGGRPVLMVEPSQRQPTIAKTAWRFQKSSGPAGTAGTIPPTGEPNFKFNRDALGVGVTGRGVRTSPAPSLQRQRIQAPKARLVRQRPAQQTARWTPQRPVTQSVPRKPVTSLPTRPVAARRISADDRIRQMISDRKVLLRTHIGAVVPIVFNSNGRMTGYAGSLSFFLGASRDRGRWWVKKGKLCQKWRVWLDQDVHCIRLKKRGGTIWWTADDGKTGTARIVSK